MLIFMYLLLLTNSTWAHKRSVGSVLFSKRNSEDCWSQDELAKLRARQIFEDVVFPALPPDKITIDYNKKVLKYFQKALRSVDKVKDRHNSEILKEALADSIGGFLRSEYLPRLRLAYYAGDIPYKSAQHMHKFYDELKMHLNTQGLGWKAPDRIPLQTNITVGKILISPGRLKDPCSGLLIKRDKNNCIRIPLPRVEDYWMPGAIALPFKAGGLVSLTSPKSENIMLKYYTTAARCILQRSPEACRHTDFVNFNSGLWHWMKQYVAPHLMDEQLYPAYGGVLRVAAAVQNYGRGLSRRSLYDPEDGLHSKQLNSPILIDKAIIFETEWTPPLAMLVVLATAIAICVLQLLYSCVIGRRGRCHCGENRKEPNLSDLKNQIHYAKIESSIPAMLPSQDEQKSPFRHSKPPSVESRHTQQVYDLNDNTVKLMSVALSDRSSYTSTSGDHVNRRSIGNATHANAIVGSVSTSQGMIRVITPRSPPKIEAPMEQLKIDRIGKRFSTSTEVTYREEMSDSVWSESYSSDHSVSSGTSKSKYQTQKSRRARDLAWARRVVSKQTRERHQTMKSDSKIIDVKSFTPRSAKR